MNSVWKMEEGCCGLRSLITFLPVPRTTPPDDGLLSELWYALMSPVPRCFQPPAISCRTEFLPVRVYLCNTEYLYLSSSITYGATDTTLSYNYNLSNTITHPYTDSDTCFFLKELKTQHECLSLLLPAILIFYF